MPTAERIRNRHVLPTKIAGSLQRAANPTICSAQLIF
jgi:hypothetical protein